MANVEVKNLSYTPVSISTGSKKGSVALAARGCRKIDAKLLDSAECKRLLAERKLVVLPPRQEKEPEKEPRRPRRSRSSKPRSSKPQEKEGS